MNAARLQSLSPTTGRTAPRLRIEILAIGLVTFACGPPLEERREAARADLEELRVQLKQYAINNGRYPTSLERLLDIDIHKRAPVVRRELPRDPWGNAYDYLPSEDLISAPRVMCLGRDGVRGGTGADADFR